MIRHKNSNILVSIILPVYNGENFLAQSIQSCLDQTYSNLELIIVNDASTDLSLKIAEEFLEKDKRIRVLSNKVNQNLPVSLNLGHKASNGEYITWTSDDNYYAPTAIEEMLTAITKDQKDLIYAGFVIINENNQKIGDYHFQHDQSLLLENTIGACFLYKRLVFDKINGYNAELFKIEDYAFWLMASKDFNFQFLPKQLYFYRSHINSLSANKKINQFVFEQDYLKKVQEMYFIFFQSLGVVNPQYISSVFRDLHLHQKINISYFLNNYHNLNRELSLVFSKYDEENLAKEIDIRVRYNILRYKSNQNFDTFISIIKYRPKILYSYSLRKSIRIIFKCFF